jgi:hypothetical protein
MTRVYKPVLILHLFKIQKENQAKSRTSRKYLKVHIILMTSKGINMKQINTSFNLQ